ncbi:MAG TPA: hypothetical protein VNG91_02155 [Terriglobia bacterium]|nr:hypothetical protein [Terriglobia bacterium]
MILIVVAVAVMAAIILYVRFAPATPNSTPQGVTEYRGSAITASPPAGFPTALLPEQGSQNISYYLNNQSFGGNYITTKTPAELASSYKQDFASLGWKVLIDNESPGQVFISANDSNGKTISLIMVKMPNGLVQVVTCSPSLVQIII